MGEMLLCGNLTMKTLDGKEIQIENAVINEITTEPNTVEILNGSRYNAASTNTHELSIQVGNITRKRFIKLLMARGIARNGAKDIASYIYKRYGCYNPMHLLMI